MILPHPGIIIMPLVRIEKTLRVIFSIVVESRQNRKLLQCTLLTIKRKSLDRCEINSYVDPLFVIF